MMPARIETRTPAEKIAFSALSAVPRAEILTHMRDPRIARHLPLLTEPWDDAALTRFLSDKAAALARDGLGHWAIWIDGTYAGWGGFQKEGQVWDYGLVLRAEFYSRGLAITRAACAWLVRNTDIRDVSVMLPESRSSRALARIGARCVGEAEYLGVRFTQWALPVRELADAANAVIRSEGYESC